VVASEVKALANQTAKATEEISAQVAAMQASTSDAVQSIGGITETIAQMSEITVGISTRSSSRRCDREIARNIHRSRPAPARSRPISRCHHGSRRTGAAATEVLSNARELDNQSGMLRSAVDEFLSRSARLGNRGSAQYCRA